MDVADLQSKVLAEIDSYRHGHADGLVGAAWPEEKVRTKLQEFRSALIGPYWAGVVRRDTAEQIKAAHPPVDRCVIVAGDKGGTLLAFDPAIAECLLVQRRGDGALESFGGNGDVVGCIMARRPAGRCAGTASASSAPAGRRPCFDSEP